MAMWNIIGEPVGRWIEPDDGKDESDAEHQNNSHMAIVLVSGHHREVISRVGFVRRLSKNPSVPFADQVRVEVDKARAAREAMAELLGDPETLR